MTKIYNHFLFLFQVAACLLGTADLFIYGMRLFGVLYFIGSLLVTIKLALEYRQS